MSAPEPSAPPQHRIRFTATARFANGGDIRLNDFMFDWPDDRPDRQRLGQAIVRNLKLLMVHDVEFHDVRVVVGAHKSKPPLARSLPTAAVQRLVGPVGIAPVTGVPPGRLLPAALLHLAGHEMGEVTLLTVEGVWDGQPVLVLAGSGEARLAGSTVAQLRDRGLTWLVADAPVPASAVPVTVAAGFVAGVTSDLLRVGLVAGPHVNDRIIGVLSETDPTEQDVP